MDPFEFFKGESSHSDVPIRTEAMSRVVIIAAVIGPDATRDQLIPYLTSRVTDLDQVTLALSLKVGELVPYVGGPEHALSLIPLLEQLCGIEETTVRVAAAGSLSKVILALTPFADYTTQIMSFFDLFMRMVGGDVIQGESSAEADARGEVFYSRVSAALIIPELFLAVPEELKSQLLEHWQTRLLGDEMAIVKRAAANVFVKTLELCGNETVSAHSPTLLAIFRKMITDETPTVKLIAVEQLSKFAAILKSAGAAEVLTNDILPVITACVNDPSWMVRKAISYQYSLLASSLSREQVASEVYPGLILLIQDQEPDVRSLALKEMLPFLEVVSQGAFIDAFIPVAVLLADAPDPQARKVLTLLLIDIACKVPAAVVAQHLSDLILRLTVDEDPLVRLRVWQRLDAMAASIPDLVTTRLTDPLKTMVNDANWRVRRHAALALPSVMKHLGKEYLQSNYLGKLLELLRDGVDMVRTAAAIALPKIGNLGGTDWAYEHIFPSIRSMANGDFKVRLSMLTALQGIMLEINDVGGGGQLGAEALAYLVAASNDKVPNVRLRCAQVLGAICPAIGPEISRTSIRPVLVGMQGDKDRDVVFFATESLKLCA